MAECSDCQTMARIIQNQQAEINRLKLKIINAQTACRQIAAEAQATMSKNCPRGTWSFAKGSANAAQRIEDVL